MEELKAVADVITGSNMNHGIQKVTDSLLMGKEMDLLQGTL